MAHLVARASPVFSWPRLQARGRGSAHRFALPRSFGTVSLTRRRLQEFVNAELEYFGRQTPDPLALETIIQAGTPTRVARLLHQELPRRFAFRVKLIESLRGWEEVPELVRLRSVFITSFRELRLAEAELSDDVSMEALAPYCDIIERLRERHKAVPALIGEAVRKITSEVQADDTVQAWADTFFKSRMATEMLTNHFAAIMRHVQNPPAEGSTQVGIVDTRCNPGVICQEAADQVLSSLSRSARDVVPDLDIEVQAMNCTHSGVDIEVPFVPRYLFYIIQELLWNSARATLESCRQASSSSADNIKVTVCSDEKQVAIRISDQGGGVPFGTGDAIWRYQFSTSPQLYEAYLDGRSPLSGRGMGLPLARLYATYMGGSLQLLSMPGIGVDAYLYLNRIPDIDDVAARVQGST